MYKSAGISALSIKDKAVKGRGVILPKSFENAPWLLG